MPLLSELHIHTNGWHLWILRKHVNVYMIYLRPFLKTRESINLSVSVERIEWRLKAFMCARDGELWLPVG